MEFQKIKSSQEMMDLVVLSTDAKPRLKWTPDLHQRFIDAVNHLGGAHKATPKGLMRIMGIPGLTLYHLKSHLQKYRLGKNHLQHQQVDESCNDSKQEDDEDSPGGAAAELINERSSVDDSTVKPTNGNLQIAKALELQMEVQKRLHEQIEVQRHLQLRIETQGKYLQKVLKKAQETLSNYASSTVGVEEARAELSQLVSMVSTEYQNSSLPDLTKSGPMSLEELDRYAVVKGRSSMESSLTSSETAREEEDKEMKINGEHGVDQLLLGYSNDNRRWDYVKQSWNDDGQLICDEKLCTGKRKGGGSAFYEVDKSSRKRLEVRTTGAEENRFGMGKNLKGFGTLDLNSQVQSLQGNLKLELGQKTQIDLNSKETEQLFDEEYLAL